MSLVRVTRIFPLRDTNTATAWRERDTTLNHSRWRYLFQFTDSQHERKNSASFNVYSTCNVWRRMREITRHRRHERYLYLCVGPFSYVFSCINLLSMQVVKWVSLRIFLGSVVKVIWRRWPWYIQSQRDFVMHSKPTNFYPFCEFFSHK